MAEEFKKYKTFHYGKKKYGIECQGRFFKGQKHGKWEFFYETDGSNQISQKEREEHWVHGEKNGTWIHYHENGKIKKTQEWKSNKENGLSVSYSEDGKFQTKLNYKEGKFDGNFIEYESGSFYTTAYEKGKLKGKPKQEVISSKKIKKLQAQKMELEKVQSKTITSNLNKPENKLSPLPPPDTIRNGNFVSTTTFLRNHGFEELIHRKRFIVILMELNLIKRDELFRLQKNLIAGLALTKEGEKIGGMYRKNRDGEKWIVWPKDSEILRRAIVWLDELFLKLRTKGYPDFFEDPDLSQAEAEEKYISAIQQSVLWPPLLLKEEIEEKTEEIKEKRKRKETKDKK